MNPHQSGIVRAATDVNAGNHDLEERVDTVLAMKIIVTRACEVSPDVRVEEIADSFSSLGHSVSVLAWNRGEELPPRETRGFGEIRRFRIRAGYGSGIRLLPKMLGFWLVLFASLLKMWFDAVHACDFDTLPPALFAAKLKGKKLVYDIFDFFAERGTVPRALRPQFVSQKNCSCVLLIP